jgi:hypothetical protein
MALIFMLSDFGRAFATRERGAELRGLLVSRAAGHDEVVVDFDKVTNVSYSFVDEFLAKLHADGHLRIRHRNLCGRVAEITDRAIQRRRSPSPADLLSA